MRGCWLLRLSPGASFWAQARQARLRHALLMLIGGYSVEQGLMLVAWAIIGWSALTGHIDNGIFLGWALLLLTAVACYGLANAAESWLATGASGLFKQRLLYSALHLEPEAIRHQGAGQFLGRVLESEEIELLAKAGGFVVVGLAGLAWPLALVQTTPARLAISLGGMLLALQAWSRLATAAQSSFRAALAWKQTGPLWRVATGHGETPSSVIMPPSAPQAL